MRSNAETVKSESVTTKQIQFFNKAPQQPLRSSWSETKLLLKGPLTDRKIERYRKLGYYSNEFRQARREMFERKKAKQQAKQNGNFAERDGRLIYNPFSA